MTNVVATLVWMVEHVKILSMDSSVFALMVQVVSRNSWKFYSGIFLSGAWYLLFELSQFRKMWNTHNRMKIRPTMHLEMNGSTKRILLISLLFERPHFIREMKCWRLWLLHTTWKWVISKLPFSSTWNRGLVHNLSVKISFICTWMKIQFQLHMNENSFSYKGLCPSPCFEKEDKGNSEV